MLNEQKKSNNSNRFYIIVLAVLLCAAIYSAVRSCSNDAGTAELYQRTDSAVERIERQHQQAASELDVTGGQLDAAGETLGRADQLIATGEERVAENAASIADCKRIVGNCQAILDDCERIYAEVEKANRTGAVSGSGRKGLLEGLGKWFLRRYRWWCYRSGNKIKFDICFYVLL